MLPISLTFAAALALFSVWLAYRIIRIRLAARINVGDGGNALLQARMRAQANFAEYSPFVLVLVVLLERAGAARTWLYGVAVVYFVARVLHAFGLERPAPNALRAVGILVTFLTLIGLAIWAVVLANAPPPAPRML